VEGACFGSAVPILFVHLFVASLCASEWIISVPSVTLDVRGRFLGLFHREPFGLNGGFDFVLSFAIPQLNTIFFCTLLSTLYASRSEISASRFCDISRLFGAYRLPLRSKNRNTDRTAVPAER
jgi:hypothetical protein